MGDAYGFGLYQQIKLMIDKRTIADWTTSDHTGIDVQVLATRAGAEISKDHQAKKNLLCY